MKGPGCLKKKIEISDKVSRKDVSFKSPRWEKRYNAKESGMGGKGGYKKLSLFGKFSE